MASSINETRMDDIKSEFDEVGTDAYGNDSDVEEQCAPGGLLRATAADYWYGKKYFENAVAQEAFLKSPKDNSIQSIDAYLQKLIREFSYQEAITSLQTENSRLFRACRITSGTDHYQLLIGLAGTTARIGTPLEKSSLLSTIQKVAGVKNSNSSYSSYQQPSSHHSTSPPISMNRVSPSGNDKEANNSHYTSMLKEKADLRGIPLDYNIERAPQDPESFRAELSYRGHTFEGFGKSKQQAKHQASRTACNFLDSQREYLY